MKEFGLNFTIDEFKQKSKNLIKKKVKELMKIEALKYLLNEKDTKCKSKMKNLNYKGLNIQNYFKSDKIWSQHKIILFKARTKMINVQHNFGQNNKCPLYKLEDDKQEHLLECVIIKIASPEILNKTDAEFNDIYSDNIEKQIKISKLLYIAIRKRKAILTK